MNTAIYTRDSILGTDIVNESACSASVHNLRQTITMWPDRVDSSKAKQILRDLDVSIVMSAMGHMLQFIWVAYGLETFTHIHDCNSHSVHSQQLS